MSNIINNRIKFNIEKFVADFEVSKFLEQSVPVLIGIFIFFNPFPHTTAIKEICYYLSVLIVLVLIFFKKKGFTFKTPLLLPVSLFVFWAFLSIFFALDKENSIHDFYSHLLRYIILYHILTNFFNSKKRLMYLSWIIIISSCIFIFGGLTYNYLIIGQDLSLRLGLTSIFAQASFNIIGVTSVFAFILGSNQLYNQKNLYLKTFLGFSLMTLLLGILMSQMRSSIIALFLSVFVLFYKNKKWMFVFLSLVLMMVIIFPVKNRFHNNMLKNIMKAPRTHITFLTLEVIKEYPIIGIGFGLQTYEKLDLEKYQKRLPQKFHQRGRIITDPHNMVLDIAVRLGVVGFVLFFYIIFAFFKMLRDIIKQGKGEFIQDWGRCLAAAFIGVSVIGLLQPIFSHMPEVVICTIFSMTTIVWRLNNNIA
jgi:O-antigen ligase